MPDEPSKYLPLPKQWSRQVQSVVLHVISLAQYALTEARGWAADSVNPRLRLSSEIERLETEVALLREEMRLKDARMARLPAARRPHYLPTERMAILELPLPGVGRWAKRPPHSWRARTPSVRG